jgi:hypothetical protein
MKILLFWFQFQIQNEQKSNFEVKIEIHYQNETKIILGKVNENGWNLMKNFPLILYDYLAFC